MIKQYSFVLQNADGGELPRFGGYALYGALLAAVFGGAAGERLHRQELSPLSQYVSRGADGSLKWTVTLLERALSDLLDARLHTLERFEVGPPRTAVRAVCSGVRELDGTAQLTDAAQALVGNRLHLRFESPTSFKSGGRYILFPTERLIVNSLIAKWNAAWPNSPFDDDITAQMLTDGMSISSYRLQSVYSSIKNVKIPGFVGEVTLHASLPEPLLALLRTLLYFGQFCGVGIKCSLGMGGMTVRGISTDEKAERAGD